MGIRKRRFRGDRATARCGQGAHCATGEIDDLEMLRAPQLRDGDDGFTPGHVGCRVPACTILGTDGMLTPDAAVAERERLEMPLIAVVYRDDCRAPVGGKSRTVILAGGRTGEQERDRAQMEVNANHVADATQAADPDGGSSVGSGVRAMDGRAVRDPAELLRTKIPFVEIGTECAVAQRLIVRHQQALAIGEEPRQVVADSARGIEYGDRPPGGRVRLNGGDVFRVAGEHGGDCGSHDRVGRRRRCCPHDDARGVSRRSYRNGDRGAVARDGGVARVPRQVLKRLARVESGGRDVIRCP